jgi:hypothetical protein
LDMIPSEFLIHVEIFPIFLLPVHMTKYSRIYSLFGSLSLYCTVYDFGLDPI